MLNPSLEPDIDRLSALYRYGVLDDEPDPFLQAVADKIATGFGGMTIQIVMVDDHRLFTVASSGELLDERSRQQSLAAATIEQMPPLVVGDLAADIRFAQSPSVLQPPRLRAFAGVALRTFDNYALGVLAASDTSARGLQDGHTALLERGAAHIMARLEIRRQNRLENSTGALIESAFREQVSALAAVAVRHRIPLSLLVVDLRILRGFGQSVRPDLGRFAIDRMSGLGLRGVRRLDAFGRIGDHAFGVLLPHTDEFGARALGRRIFEGLVDAPNTPTSADAAAPLGIGIATLRQGLDGPRDMIDRAVLDCRRSWIEERRRGSLAPQVA